MHKRCNFSVWHSPAVTVLKYILFKNIHQMTQVLFFLHRQNILCIHSSSALVRFQTLTLKLQRTLIGIEWWLAVTDTDPRTTWATRCRTPLPADVTLAGTSGLWGWPLFSSLYEGCAYFQPLVRPNDSEGVVKHIVMQLCRRGLWRSEEWVSAALPAAHPWRSAETGSGWG